MVKVQSESDKIFDLGGIQKSTLYVVKLCAKNSLYSVST